MGNRCDQLPPLTIGVMLFGPDELGFGPDLMPPVGPLSFVEYQAAMNELAQFRRNLGLPPAGIAGDKATLARLDIGGESFIGINGHGQTTTFVGVNKVSPTHAEGDVFQQALNAGIRSKTAHLFTDRPLCQYCGLTHGVRNMARNLGLETVEVWDQSGYKGTIRTR